MAVFSAAVAVVGAVATWVGGLGVVGQLAVRLAIGLALNALGAAMQGKQKGPKPPGIKGQIEQGADLPRSFILGRCATAGSLVYHNTTSNKKIYSRVTALSDLPIEGIEEVWVDGKRCEIDFENPSASGRGWPLKSFNTYIKKTLVGFGPLGSEGNTSITDVVRVEEVTEEFTLGWVKFYDGNQTAADQYLIDHLSTVERPWTDRHIGTGVAYAVTHFKHNTKHFTSFPQIVFVLKGIHLQEPGAGTAYSDQPGAMAHTLLQGLSHSGVALYGPQTPAPMDAQEWAAEIARERADVPGAAAMDDAERLEVFGSTAIPARYRAGYEVSVDEPIADVFEAITAASNGQVSFVGARYRYRIGDPSEPAMSITDGDLLSLTSQRFGVFPALTETVNAITATYPDPDQVWQNQSAPILTNPDYEIQDGNRQLPANADLTAVPYPEQVQRLMRAALSEARQARVHKLPLPPMYSVLEVDDHIEWTSDRNGYSDKVFRVDAIAQMANGDVIADVAETDPDSYNWQPTDDYRPMMSAPVGLAEVDQAEVEGFTASAVNSVDGAETVRRPAIGLTWMPPENSAIYGVMWQVVEAVTQTLVHSAMLPDAELGGHVISEGLLPDQSYLVRLRFVSDVLGTPWSDWDQVATGDVRLTEADFADETAARIAEAHDRHDAALDQAEGTIADLRDAVIASLGPLNRIEPLANEIPRLDAGLEESYQRLMDVQWAQFKTDRTLAGAGIVIDADTGLVQIAAFTEASERIARAEINISGVEAEISQKVTFAEMNAAISGVVLDPTRIPVIGDLSLQITSLETSLNAQDGAITTLADTLTVDGGLVTMVTVTEALDSLNGVLVDKVAQAEFNAAELRVTAAEQSLEALGDVAAIRDTVEVTRARGLSVDEGVLRDIGDLWGRWQGDVVAREATAQGQRELHAKVNENFEAQAAERLALAVEVDAANAALVAESKTRAAEDEALAEQITQMEAGLTSAGDDISGNAAALSGLSTRVSDVEGDVSSQASDITQLESDLTDTQEDVSGTAQALSSLTTRVQETEEGVTSVSNASQQLRSDVDGTASTVNSHATTIATLSGNASATYTMRLAAGGASAGLEMVAADNPVSGPTSSLRFSADNILLDGSVLAKHIAAGSITAGHIEAGGITAEKINTTDLVVTGEMLVEGAVSSIANTAPLAGTLAAGAYANGTSVYVEKPEGYYIRMTITATLTNNGGSFGADSYIGFTPQVRAAGTPTWDFMQENLRLTNFQGTEMWNSGSYIAIFDPSTHGGWNIRLFAASNSASNSASYEGATIQIEVIRK
ncbi:phage tail protein [Pelagimonas varians]|uniref:Chromosome partition protein Smc n=1 Tax=Pelagimonas varians TaxID=696760 RepID=A0A238K054_9RHOB|nr:phage tail protein [Pelagimonas varians]PYG33128.1 uncharacterized protein DUF1983 [Pelagimonas varians]SMX35764.1 Chromosome partition protein Smc [Pelagimonas varians]